MDPDACLERLIDAAISADADGVLDAAADLADWLGRGGFPPQRPDRG